MEGIACLLRPGWELLATRGSEYLGCGSCGQELNVNMFYLDQFNCKFK